MASASQIKNRLNQQITANNLALSSLSTEEAQQLLRGLNGEYLLQTGQMLYADGDEQAQAAPAAEEAA
jgi:hypothetical protein